MTNRLNGCRLDPAMRNRVLEALKTLTDALDQSAANHSYAATDNLRAAADKAMRAFARLALELHADSPINPARAFHSGQFVRKITAT